MLYGRLWGLLLPDFSWETADPTLLELFWWLSWLPVAELA